MMANTCLKSAWIGCQLARRADSPKSFASLAQVIHWHKRSVKT